MPSCWPQRRDSSTRGRDRDRRAASVEAGRRRALDFSWRTCAEKTLAVYREALGGLES